MADSHRSSGVMPGEIKDVPQFDADLATLNICCFIWPLRLQSHYLEEHQLDDVIQTIQNGIGTKAIVTKTNCSNHMTFSYRFDFNGQSIDGSGGDGYGNPSCDTLKEGDPVLIYYLPRQPEINVPGDPKKRLNNETISIMTAALIFPPLAFAINRWTTKKRKININQGDGNRPGSSYEGACPRLISSLGPNGRQPSIGSMFRLWSSARA
jgi:hypothetical protein